VLLFSDNNGEVVYQFPYYDYFKAELEPLLHEVRRSSPVLLCVLVLCIKVILKKGLLLYD
jgi:hypothetical protein